MRLAWELFNLCERQWDRESDGWGNSRKIGVPYDRLQIRAEAHGLILTPAILDCFDLLVERQLLVDAINRQRDQDENAENRRLGLQ